jgi:dUTP pyrophosphatase
MKLKVKKVHHAAILPNYATKGAACFDLHAVDCADQKIPACMPTTVRTGLAFEVPHGHVMLIFSRSGHGFKNDTRLANCVGVIDSDYRGEVMVRLTRDISLSESLSIKAGDRIAQAMLVALPWFQIVESDELTDTARGAGGFGHTGA